MKFVLSLTRKALLEDCKSYLQIPALMAIMTYFCQKRSNFSRNETENLWKKLLLG